MSVPALPNRPAVLPLRAAFEPGERTTTWLSLGLIFLVSALYEAFFLHYGINRIDESWQLYAGMRLHAGGVLYDDVLWVFPPGHVWTGWLAWWADPPGIVFARYVYSAFTVALCLSLYLVGRRLMEPPFALLGALLLALAAPRSHVYQLLFGYRYLVIPFLALLAFDRRLRGGDSRWMFLSGGLTGLALVFRLTPAFSVSCGIALALIAAHHRHWQRWLPDGLRFTTALVAALAPVLLWFSTTVGLPRMWQEIVLHPLAMLQPLPLPEIIVPDSWNRTKIQELFVAIQFRAIWVFYFGYLAGIAWSWLRWLRSDAQSEPFRHSLLLAIVIFGGVFFIRSTGRSDEPHLDSVIPPVCLLVAHSLWLAFDRGWRARGGLGGLPRNLTAGVLGAGVLSLWVFLLQTDRVLQPSPEKQRALESVRQEIVVRPMSKANDIDRVVRLLEKHTRPSDLILNMGPTPLFHILSGRTGPGYFDVIMPGTFTGQEDEKSFLERLKRSRPAAVIWPTRKFDSMESRAVTRTAPMVSRWVRANYFPVKIRGRWVVLIPKNTDLQTRPARS